LHPKKVQVSVQRPNILRPQISTKPRLFLNPLVVANGTAVSAKTQMFVGAKEWETIRNYEKTGIEGFLDSIDWGWFFFITKPMFAVLHWLNLLIGNMGWAIIGLTLLIKALLFPIGLQILRLDGPK